MTIGDLLFALGIDGSRLTQDVTKEAEKAGDAGAKTLTQRMSAGLKTGGINKLSASLSLITAGVAKGAMSMEDETARFASATGTSLEESKRVLEGVNRIAGEQQQSLSSVTDAAIAVKRDMGLVGDEATAMTEKIVKFARVTGLTATDAVKGLDDVTDSWGLTTKDTSVVMDKMIVSQQKFGGSIQDNIATLSALAPAMRAANMTVDDGIALLGLFGSKGLDAGQASAAFAKALTKVKSPAELQALITDISNTTDPFQRAAKAADLFGAKAGAKLANALGGVDLKDYRIGMNEAADATNHAADVLDSSFGAQARKKISEFGAALRGIGADFGSVISAAASLGLLANAIGLKIPLGPFARIGKRLGGAIATGIGSAIVGRAGEGIVADSVADAVTGAGKSSRVSGALSKAGKFMGTGLGKAFSLAFAAAAVIGVIETANQIQDEVDAQQAGIAKGIADQVVKGNREGLQQSKAALEQGIKDIQNNTALNIFSAPDKLLGGKGFAQGQIDQLQSQLDAVNKALDDGMARAGEHAQVGGEAVGEAATSGIAAGLKNAVGLVTGVVQDFAAKFKKVSHGLGQDFPGDFASGVRSERDTITSAFDQLKTDIANAMDPIKERAKLVGMLTSKRLAAGLKSGDTVVRHQAEETQRLILDRLAELAAQGTPLGKKGAEAVAKGLRSKNEAVRTAAQHVVDVAAGKLDNLAGQAGAAGGAAGAAFARRLRAAAGARIDIQLAIHAKYDNGKGNAVGGPVRAGVPTWVNEHTANSEIFVPSASGRILTHAEAVNAVANASGSGGGDVTINVPVMGALPVRTARDIVTELRRVGDLGILPPPTLSPQYPRRLAENR